MIKELLQKLLVKFLLCMLDNTEQGEEKKHEDNGKKVN